MNYLELLDSLIEKNKVSHEAFIAEANQAEKDNNNLLAMAFQSKASEQHNRYVLLVYLKKEYLKSAKECSLSDLSDVHQMD